MFLVQLHHIKVLPRKLSGSMSPNPRVVNVTKLKYVVLPICSKNCRVFHRILQAFKKPVDQSKNENG